MRAFLITGAALAAAMTVSAADAKPMGGASSYTPNAQFHAQTTPSNPRSFYAPGQQMQAAQQGSNYVGPGASHYAPGHRKRTP
jgi:hypothetical protein